jgi:drug/metabolite transporter (DMT)-like permease
LANKPADKKVNHSATTTRTANLAGAGAVALWASLALFTDLTAPVPPFQLMALTFAIGALTCLVWVVVSGQTAALTSARPVAVLWGAVGLFGYHALYFAALREAPVAEASLIAYLWPLLIVVLAVPLLGSALTLYHLAGVGLGFAGVVVLILLDPETSAGATLGFGHLLALGCAFTWSTYSVLSRKAAAQPSAIVTLYCALTAVSALVAHLMLETTVWPTSSGGWFAIAALGLGPVGAAFFLWDIATKRGDLTLVAALSYAAPVLSTALLILSGRAAFQVNLVLAAGLVCLGALIAASPRRKS